MGWILMECKPGEPLDQHFEALSDGQKDAVISQIADVFAMVQGAKLPETVKAYGGLTIGHDGAIVSGEMTTLEGGPWDMFVEFMRTKLASQLRAADESPALKGWRDNGVRERVDALLESGLGSKLREAGVDGTQRVLIHGDLSELPSPFSKIWVEMLTRSLSDEQHPFRPCYRSDYRPSRL